MTTAKKSIYAVLETDSDLEANGITLDFGDYGKFQVARAGGANQAYNARSAAVLKPYRRQIDVGAMTEERLRELLAVPFAETVIKGWEGVTDRDGNDLPFTRENCIQILKDLPALFDTIREHATSVSNYRKEEVEAAVKN